MGPAIMLVNRAPVLVVGDLEHDPQVSREASLAVTNLLVARLRKQISESRHASSMHPDSNAPKGAKPARLGKFLPLPRRALRLHAEVMHDFQQRALANHANLPGILRALLHDHGITNAVIEIRQVGWDGCCLTVPVRDRSGRVVFFERWDANEVGIPVDKRKLVELFGWDHLKRRSPRIVIAEGIHEALVLESHGIAAIAATNSGLFFKPRVWAPPLARVPELYVAFRRGDKLEPGKYLPSRQEIVEAIQEALPAARLFEWPADVGDQGGALEFFAVSRRSTGDFEKLLRTAV